MLTKLKDKIVVAMSGGVDSSTAAAILQKQNYQVIGITLQLYNHTEQQYGKTCCAGQDIYDAKVVAEQIGIPHYTIDYQDVFKKQVINNFTKSYIRGETPIPCVDCNQKVKFTDLLQLSKTLGAKSLATGHYVKKVKQKNEVMLYKGNDPVKDQSYFLFNTSKVQLDFLEFPLGNMTKAETRNIAKQYNLKTANKSESQNICFVPDGDYAGLIKKLCPENHQSGDIVLSNGSIIGKHQGIIHYTVGQRRKIGISSLKPLYVLKIIAKENKIVVGPKEELMSKTFIVKDLNWLLDDDLLNNEIQCNVKIRSQHPEIAATVKYLTKGFAKIILKDVCYGVSPGQACVMYDNGRVLGGGWITDKIDEKY